jgi:tetratricopeptide (TPR) repeat protein
MLTLDDVYVLSGPLAAEVNRQLPIPGTIDFYALTGDGILHPLQEYLADERRPVADQTASFSQPRIMDDQLIIPLALASGECAVAVVSEVDPGFLRKMSASWLREMRDEFLQNFEHIRLASIDPETGLYNRRAAAICLSNPAMENPGFFLLINTVFYRRSAAGNLQKLRETADLLMALTRGQCFSFGYGVFGLLLPVQSRKRALHTVHYLQRQLRREGMSKVQVGFSRVTRGESQSEVDVPDRFWRSLAIAEKRGPVGICDIDSVDERHPHPFQLPHAVLLEKVREQWRGLPRFTLALLSRQPMTETTTAFDAFMEQAVNGDGLYCAGDDVFSLILFPGHTQQTVASRVDALAQSCRVRYGEEAVAVSVASWPCLDFNKGDVPRNCLKAYRHGSFLGPGSVVFFDHLSLNISGDYYFDEGDYQAALREYRRGLRMQPGDVNLINSLGVALVECNRERQAAECFQDVLRQDPDNYMALVNLGHARQTLGDKAGALACFERAYQAHAQDESAGQELFLPLGRLYAELGRHDQAVVILEHWRDRPGSDREFLLFRLLGESYMEDGRPGDAVKACQRALRLFPQDSVSLSILGLLYVEQGEGDELGLSLCNKALSLDNFNPGHWRRLSRALLRLGNSAEAFEAGKQCLRLRRNDIEGLLQLGDVYSAMGRAKSAKKCFTQALALKKCNATQAARLKKRLDDV